MAFLLALKQAQLLKVPFWAVPSHGSSLTCNPHYSGGVPNPPEPRAGSATGEKIADIRISIICKHLSGFLDTTCHLIWFLSPLFDHNKSAVKTLCLWEHAKSFPPSQPKRHYTEIKVYWVKCGLLPSKQRQGCVERASKPAAQQVWVATPLISETDPCQAERAIAPLFQLPSK